MSKRANKKRPNKQLRAKRSPRTHTSLVLIEALPEYQRSGESAAVSRHLQSLGLLEAPMMEVPVSGDQSRYFAAHQFPGTTNGCRLVVSGALRVLQPTPRRRPIRDHRSRGDHPPESTT